MTNKAGQNPGTALPSFNEVMNLLSKVKSPDDVTQELADVLLGASIATFIKVQMENDDETTYFAALQIARISMLQYFDVLIAEQLAMDSDEPQP